MSDLFTGGLFGRRKSPTNRSSLFEKSLLNKPGTGGFRSIFDQPPSTGSAAFPTVTPSSGAIAPAGVTASPQALQPSSSDDSSGTVSGLETPLGPPGSGSFQSYNGTPFYSGVSVPNQLLNPEDKAFNSNYVGRLSDNGMWRFDRHTKTWKWWIGNIAGKSVRYSSKDGEPSEADVRNLTGTPTDLADEAEARFRKLMEPFLKQLMAILDEGFPEVPDIQTFIDQAGEVRQRLQADLTQDELNQSLKEAAIGAGFFTLDADKNVTADLAGYNAAMDRFQDPNRVPQPGDDLTTDLQRRQLAQARRNDARLAENIVSGVAGESFSKFMRAAHEATAGVAERDLKRRMAIGDQNFKQAILAIQAEDQVFISQMQSGGVSRQAWLNRRERAIIAELDTVYKNANLHFQQFQAEITSILANVEAIVGAANMTMGIELGASQIWQNAYDEVMRPIQDALDAAAQQMELDAENDIWGKVWDGFVSVLAIVVPALISALLSGDKDDADGDPSTFDPDMVMRR